MPDLADLYPGFASHWIDTASGRIFVRTGGAGPPLLLLHGYPQTNVMWHRVAPMLAERFSLVIPDLPGYGWSAAPRSDAEHTPYTKRAMANAMIEVMESARPCRASGSPATTAAAASPIGSRSIIPAGSNRLATLDIVPTWAMWHGMDAQLANRTWHWMFLALPAPFPETMIGKDPIYFFDTHAAAGTKAKSLAAFDPRALAHYHAFFNDPVRIHATCEDYRAGRTADLAHDEADRAAGKKIGCPMLALWGAGGIPAETAGPLATWREWATNVRGFAIDCGHYLAEEAPAETAKALLEFFAAG